MRKPYKKALRVLFPLALAAGVAALCVREVDYLATTRTGYGDKKVVINEICAHNLSGLTDGYGKYSDWIELYSAAGRPLDISGWTITDSAKVPDKWTFPQGSILKDYIVLFADSQTEDQDQQDPNGYYHLPFSLGTDGETLYLYDDAGNLQDELTYPAQKYDFTYGRAFGSYDETGIFAVATPGETNPIAFKQADDTAELGTVYFSKKAGFYEEPFTLYLQCDDPDTLIFYTTDGSDPKDSGTMYLGGIALKSREGEPNEFASRALQTYVIWDEEKPVYLENFAYRYAPDPVDKATTVTVRLYKDKHWSEEMQARTYWIGVEQHTLPVVSVVAEPGKIFGADGIYEPGSTYFTLHKYGEHTQNSPAIGNFSLEREVDATVQIVDGEHDVSLPAEISISGGMTRARGMLKNLAVELQDGMTSDVLADAVGTDAKKFTLRGPGSGVPGFSAWRDLYQSAFLNNYLYGEGLATQYNLSVVLYLQDEYWGVYTIRESKGRQFFEDHYGVDHRKVQRFGNGNENAEAEKLAEELRTLPHNQAAWKWLNEQFDLDNYMDYLIASMFLNNRDGLYANTSNMLLWKADGDGEENPYQDGRWRFVLNDLDATLQEQEMDPFEKLDKDPVENDIPVLLFQKVWKYPEFREQFAEKMREAVQTIYAPENTLPAFDAWCEQLAPEMPRMLERCRVELTPLAPMAGFLTHADPQPQLRTMDDWEGDCEQVRTFLRTRGEILLNYLDEYLADENYLAGR